MPRPERPLKNGPPAITELAAALRVLRHRAGTPSYREMSERAHYSVSVLSRAVSGERLPTWNVVRAYVLACDGDPEEWLPRWEVAYAATHDTDRDVVDYGSIRSLDELLAVLRGRMREQRKPYRDLAQLTSYPATTVHDLLNGRSLLRRPYLEHILGALYDDEGARRDLLRAFERIADLATTDMDPDTPTRRRAGLSTKRALAALLGGLLLVTACLSGYVAARPASPASLVPLSIGSLNHRPRLAVVAPFPGISVTTLARSPTALAVDGVPVQVLRPAVQVSVRTPLLGWRVVHRPIQTPCAYYRVWTGREMAGQKPAAPGLADSAVATIYDPAGRRGARRIALPLVIRSIESGRDQVAGSPYSREGPSIPAPAVAAHSHDNTGYWWLYRCDLAAQGLDGPSERELDLLASWHAQVSDSWVFWEPGHERLPADIPIDPLTVIANLQAAIGDLDVYFNPAPAVSKVGLMTWASVVVNPRGPLDLRLTVDDRSVTARAQPNTLHATATTTASPFVDLGKFHCPDGGFRYDPEQFKRLPDGLAWYCGIFFAEPGGYRMQFARDWTLSINGSPVAGRNGTYTTVSPPYVFHVTSLVPAGR
jgi:hypothetical protein